MGDGANVATTVGIWIAVVVVVLAVLGVGGSVFVYKSSKTGRHHALKAIDHQSGYITLGLGIGSTRISRRVKAPILAYEPNFSGEAPDPRGEHHSTPATVVARAQKHIKKSTGKGSQDDPIYHGDTPLQLEIDDKVFQHGSISSWISLGKLLEAYKKLPIVQGDTLLIEQNKAFLPVHRLWILTLGLLGRYGTRSLDNILSASTRLRAPGTGTGRSESSMNRETPESYPLTQFTGTDRPLLRGTTGAINLYRHDTRSAYTFVPHDANFLKSIRQDKLSLRSLYWLALGAIPCGEGTVYSMVDLEPTKNSSSSSNEIQHGDSTSNSRNERSSLVSPTQQSRGAIPHHMDVRLKPPIRRCKFVKINNNDYAPFDVIHRLGSAKQTLWGLQEEPLDSLPAFDSSEWVTLPPSDFRDLSDTSVWKLERSDAQRIARRLLEMKWSPEGFLFGRNRATRLWRFLSTAADNLRDLLDRTRLNLNIIGENDSDKEKLKDVLDPAIRACNRHDLDRAGTGALFDALNSFTERLSRKKADEIIGELVFVLFITDPKFRHLVMQSSKHLSPSSQNSRLGVTTTTVVPVTGDVITYSRPASAILVPSAFGVKQSFRIDLDWLYHENGATQRWFREAQGREEIQASLRVVILAALRAGCVSALLRGAWSSEPLLNFFDECSQGVVFS